MSRSAIALLVALAGCSANEPRTPVIALVGEVTVHQFPGWTHAWAAFPSVTTPVDAVQTGTLFHLSPAATQLGPCTVTVAAHCAAGCPGGSWCDGTDHCAPVPDWQLHDAGPVEVEGCSGGITRIAMQFADGGFYATTPPPGPGICFGALDRLRFSVPGAGETMLVAPPAIAPVEHASDVARAGLVHWQPGPAEAVVVVLSASTDDGRAVDLRCVGPDTGALTIPGSALAQLPAPPRRLHLELGRDVQVLADLGGGRGVLVHAGQTTVEDVSE